uniref:Uncharacterized protein n=1 Tax=Panagrellus redivivus TaxID=6233 RepID=A0A7E4VVH4_PANRE
MQIVFLPGYVTQIRLVLICMKSVACKSTICNAPTSSSPQKPFPISDEKSLKRPFRILLQNLVQEIERDYKTDILLSSPVFASRNPPITVSTSSKTPTNTPLTSENLQSYDDLVTQFKTEKRVLAAIMMRRSAKKHEQEFECNSDAFKQPAEDGQSDAKKQERSNTATQHDINVFGSPPNG